MPVQVRLPALFFRLNPHFQLSAGVGSFSLLNIPIIALAEEISRNSVSGAESDVKMNAFAIF